MNTAVPSGQLAARPRYSALGSTRGRMLPALPSAMDRFRAAFLHDAHAADLSAVAVRLAAAPAANFRWLISGDDAFVTNAGAAMRTSQYAHL